VTRGEQASRDSRSRVENAAYDRDHPAFPLLLTVDEAAYLLRTSCRAIYAMVERRQLPGVIRIRRRVLFGPASC
jgi:excisionase family DNA binding protein